MHPQQMLRVNTSSWLGRPLANWICSRTPSYSEAMHSLAYAQHLADKTTSINGPNRFNPICVMCLMTQIRHSGINCEAGYKQITVMIRLYNYIHLLSFKKRSPLSHSIRSHSHQRHYIAI